LGAERNDVKLYNLLVSGLEGAWEKKRYEMPKSRFGEYTAEAIKIRYQSLDENLIEELKSFPALFAYEEGYDIPARVGYLTQITQSSGTIQLKFKLIEEIPPISSEQWSEISWDLDIKKWEMNRTHWALKDVDLLDVLRNAGLLGAGEILRELIEPRVQLSVYSQNQLLISPIVFAIPRVEVDPNLVSVMMPFSREFDTVYASIQSACQGVGLRCERVDDVWEESTIIQDIFNLIFRSAVVIVDLSGQNSNVLYETGIAHTLGRPVVPISQQKDSLPFDLIHHRTLHYFPNEQGLAEMKVKLGRRLRSLTR
jgi:hypothetical protein